VVKPIKGKPPQAAAQCALDWFYRLCCVICGDGEYKIFSAKFKRKKQVQKQKPSARSKTKPKIK